MPVIDGMLVCDECGASIVGGDELDEIMRLVKKGHKVIDTVLCDNCCPEEKEGDRAEYDFYLSWLKLRVSYRKGELE